MLNTCDFCMKGIEIDGEASFETIFELCLEGIMLKELIY